MARTPLAEDLLKIYREALAASHAGKAVEARLQVSSGAIRYSWRLILAPTHLLRWVVAHEVAHRRHMDHGPQFRALEAELFEGDVRAARAELRALGPRLKRVGLGL